MDEFKKSSVFLHCNVHVHTSYIYQTNTNVWHSFNWQVKLEKIYLVTEKQCPKERWKNRIRRQNMEYGPDVIDVIF